MRIIVSDRRSVPKQVAALKASGSQCMVMSLLAPDGAMPAPWPRFSFSRDAHVVKTFRIEVDDIIQDVEAPYAPSPDTARQIEFAARSALLRGVDLLVHCEAGQSRSTAAALGALWIKHQGAAHEGNAALLEEAVEVASTRTRFRPNTMLVSLLDERLSAGGELIAFTKRLLQRLAVTPDLDSSERDSLDWGT